MQKILSADDSAEFNIILSGALRARFQVEVCADGRIALERLRACRADVLVVDLLVPGMDGMDLLKNIRSWSGLPIVVVSARSHERDKVAALDAGADDYLTKPFSVTEMLARLRVAQRRISSTAA